MARGHRTWGQAKTVIYRYLDEASDSTFYTPELLLDFANEVKDQMEMQMYEAHEGFGVFIKKADIVADQSMYEIPADTGRLKRVIRNYVSESREQPLDRYERFGEGKSTESSQSLQSEKLTYRLVDNHIILEPTPGTAEVDGLIVEMELATDLIVADSVGLPDSWPIHSDHLWILNTTIAALDYEDDLGPPVDDEARRRIIRRRDRYEVTWLNYIETRSFGRTYAIPFKQGA